MEISYPNRPFGHQGLEERRWPSHQLIPERFRERNIPACNIQAATLAKHFTPAFAQQKTNVVFDKFMPKNLEHPMWIEMNEETRIKCKDEFHADLPLNLSLSTNNINDHIIRLVIQRKVESETSTGISLGFVPYPLTPT